MFQTIIIINLDNTDYSKRITDNSRIKLIIQRIDLAGYANNRTDKMV